jgi:hypothetical protein
MDTYALRGDKEAERRLEVKKKAEGARRAIRYQRFIDEKKEVPFAKQDQVFSNRRSRRTRR